jgi:hypothetical protein
MFTLVHDLKNLIKPFVGTLSGIVGLLFLNAVHILPKIVKFKSCKNSIIYLSFILYRDIFQSLMP